MSEATDLLARLGAALAIGLLLGLERGWEQRELAEGQRVAGFRTFALVSLFGAVTTVVAGDRPWFLGAAMLALGAIVAVGYFRTSQASSDRSATGEVALLLAFGLGAMAARAWMLEAASTAVVVTLILGFKPELHGLLRKIEREELLATIRLLLISVVMLPVLPDRGIGPWEVLNPYKIWWMVVLVAGLSYAGYVAERIWGRDRGALVAGLLGGLVSSTVVTLELSRRAAKSRSSARDVDATAAGIVVASTIMFLRQLAILVPVAPNLVSALVVPIGITSAVGLLSAAALFFRSRRRASAEPERGLGLKNPLDLSSALGFGLLLAAILIVSRALTASLGDRGLYLAAALSGIADVDAITLSIGTMTNAGDVGTGAAIAGVLVAAATNTMVKSATAAAIGGGALGVRVVPPLAAAVASGAAALWITTTI